MTCIRYPDESQPNIISLPSGFTSSDYSRLVTRNATVQGKPPKGNLIDAVMSPVLDALPPVLEEPPLLDALPPVLEEPPLLDALPPVLEVLPPTLMHEAWVPEFPPAVSHVAF